MLYLTIPLFIALAAIAAIVIIVWRKMSYLRKLTPESHEMGETILHDYAPELIEWFKGIPWRQYLQSVLVEFEKILSRGRSFMSSLDRVYGKFIKKVRRVHEETGRQHEQIIEERRKGDAERRTEEEEQVIERRKGDAERRKDDPDEASMEDPEQLKQEEQRLIVAIAQNPKDVHLYSDLARIYMRVHAYGDAVEALEQAAKLEPQNEEFLKRLERAKRKKIEAAETLIS